MRYFTWCRTCKTNSERSQQRKHGAVVRCPHCQSVDTIAYALRNMGTQPEGAHAANHTATQPPATTHTMIG